MGTVHTGTVATGTYSRKYICFMANFFWKFTEEKRRKAFSEGNLEDLLNNPRRSY
jgi:hypothetical protein